MATSKAGKAGTIKKHPKFAPFTLDFTFKKAFANEQSRELLVFLLNTFLKRVLKKPIADVKIIQTVQLAKTRKGRGAVFDLQCEDAAGARFIVEMQLQEQEHFIKRTFFYLCLAVASLAKKGKQESRGKKIPYDFNIPTIYTLGFMNFDLDFGKGCDEIVQYISLSNDLHPEIRYDFMHMVYVQLAKFNKTERECRSDMDRLLFTFKNADKLDKAPSSFAKREFKQLFDIAKISNFTDEEYMDYERQMKYFSDSANALAFAEKKGAAIGEARGVAIGREEGVAIGEARGEARGMERLVQAARNMLGEGIEPALVARCTKLPLKAVKALR